MTSSSTSEKGLGLIQVLFFLLFITISASVVVMNTTPIQKSGGSDLTWQRVDKIRAAIDSYRADVGSSPSSLDALTSAPSGSSTCSPDTNPSSSTYRKLRGWCGPYLERDPAGSDLQKRDGWGTLLQYNGTSLVSCGPNRSCGDGDDITITP